MNRNPIIPFLLIMVFGIGLVFFLSLKGLNDSEQAAKEKKGGGAKTEQTAESFDPESFFKQTCAGCHGQNYEGGVGPSLKGIGKKLSKDQIKNIIQHGKGPMPAGLVSADHADQMADWLMKLK
jgi:cytochrome c550